MSEGLGTKADAYFELCTQARPGHGEPDQGHRLPERGVELFGARGLELATCWDVSTVTCGSAAVATSAPAAV
jgi:hypothetical protein